MNTLTAELLRQLLSYDSETGIFKWLMSASTKICIGSVTSARVDAHGYSRIWLNGMSHKCHRLAWLYVYGEWPHNHIDHINGVRHDNRIANLRDVSHSVNLQNLQKARSDNSSGLLGVTKIPSGWVAQIWFNRKQHHLGVFKTPESAHAAYITAKRQFHEGCTI